MATQKQVNYVLGLLGKAGYSTRYMDSRFKFLGANMRERSGLVEDWIRGKNNDEIDKLITILK